MRSLILLLTVLSVSGYSQTTNKGTIKVKKEEKENIVYTVVEQMPEFPGGNQALMTFVSINTVYPAGALENGISGTVYIAFTVFEDGSINDVRLLKGIPGCIECDMEALRVIRLMPPFSPGKKDGKPVKVYYNLPLRFNLR